MSPSGEDHACHSCLRRAWLLQTLSARLAYRAREPERLLQALTLGDEELVQAIGGRRRKELFEQHARFDPTEARTSEGVQRICRHDRRYPATLRVDGAPRTLHLMGGIERMQSLLRQPVVAIVGTRRASDYGMEVAYGLARGLAASGITVVSGFAEGIPAAAHQGALHTGAATVTVMAGGVDVPHPASWRGLYRHIAADSCVLAELPCGGVPRNWCHIARKRIVVALARLVIVVEAQEHPSELLHARLARRAGKALAATPGRLSAPAARGPHLLLREGALLVRDAQDVLDALYGVGERHATATRPSREGHLRNVVGERHLRKVLEQVGAGNDTVAKLTADEALGDGCASANDVLLALAELECSGAITRGDGGRYLVCM